MKSRKFKNEKPSQAATEASFSIIEREREGTEIQPGPRLRPLVRAIALAIAMGVAAASAPLRLAEAGAPDPFTNYGSLYLANGPYTVIPSTPSDPLPPLMNSGWIGVGYGSPSLLPPSLPPLWTVPPDSSRPRPTLFSTGACSCTLWRI